MSTLAIDKIKGRTSAKETDVNNLSSQIASAWVNFDGTGTVAIRQSYNVSSITDNGTGLYTINFTTAFSSATYAFLGMCGRDSVANASAMVSRNTSLSATTSALPVRTFDVANTSRDSNEVSVSIFSN